MRYHGLAVGSRQVSIAAISASAPIFEHRTLPSEELFSYSKRLEI
jgi:hypothetical protein